MHHCLTNAEILRAIFSSIDEKATLAGLATTCRAFQGYALDVLYEEIGLCDLLRTISGDAIAVEGGELGLRRPLREEDFETLKSYARRAKELYVPQHPWDGGPCPNEDLLNGVSVIRSNSNTLLTPSLRSLHVTPDWSEYITILPAFISRELESLYLVGAFVHKPWLSTIPSLCPSLKNLSFYPPTVDTADLSFVADWRQLQVIKCGAITAKTFERASFCPLRRFTFKIRENDDSWTSLQLDPSSFSELADLSISTSCGVECITPFLGQLSLPNLTELSVRHGLQSLDEEKAMTLFKIIGRFHSLSNLVIYDLHGKPGLHVNADVFRPLLHLRHLEELVIRTCSFAMDDHILEEIAKAMPNLHEVLIFSSTAKHPPRATLSGLNPLFEHCKKLSFLHISVNAESVPSTPDLPWEGICNTSLRCLKLVDSPICNSGAVARFLSDTVPSLEGVVPVGSSSWNDWLEVNYLMKIFASTRECMERTWVRRRTRK